MPVAWSIIWLAVAQQTCQSHVNGFISFRVCTGANKNCSFPKIGALERFSCTCDY